MPNFGRSLPYCSYALFIVAFTLSQFFTNQVAVNLLTKKNVADSHGIIPYMEVNTTQLPTFIWATLPKERKGRGVLFSAYSFDEVKSLPRFLDEAAAAATELKAHNPTVSVAIITNAKTVPEIFDHIVPVAESMLFNSQSIRPDGIFRQWFARIFYMAHSPFQTTWHMDSHAKIPSTRLMWALEEFEKSGLDIAVASQQPNGFKCHNFNMVFTWNERVRTLFVDWMLRQLQIGVSLDDQFTLCKALACAGGQYGLRYGAISSNWAFAWLSLKWGQDRVWWKHRTTRLISGAAEVCHSAEGALCDAALKLNASDAMKPHIFYYHIGVSQVVPIFSQQEIDNILPYKFVWEDWTVKNDMFERIELACPDQ